MVESADGDGDRNLTLGEMLNNPYVFYSSAIAEEEHDLHDEF